MVHISDGILAPWLWGSGWVITAAILAYTLKKMKIDDVPKLSVITAAIFVASLIRIPAGLTSVHLVLSGFAGVTLGILAYPCIFIALVMQAFLFQHGGITTIGINTVNMGVPALISFFIFKAGMKLKLNIGIRKNEILFGAIAGGIAVALAVLLLAVELLVTGEQFTEIATTVVLAHIPVILVEAIFTGVIAGFLATVKPEMLSIGR
ncbi:MAG TPA: cobalt transporter CbiM [Methanosarcinaceae archaeon]|nr:cobalt transporter CbiM [Methanosarcinaceae archaeon]HJH30813.1 cobalt transporter CbiM [Methanosarcinaceae archaeon]